jgi:hypothetical protein
MALDNEQIQTKLAVLETQITNLVQSSQRVESLLERISLFDKTQAELLQRHVYLNERYVEIAKEVEKCSQTHEGETERLWKEVIQLKDTASRAQGVSIGAMALLGIIASIATYFFTYLFSTAQENRAAYIRQGQQILQLEKQISTQLQINSQQQITNLQSDNR